MAQDAKWHKIARYDSAIVSMPDAERRASTGATARGSSTW